MALFCLDGRVLDVRPYTGDYHTQFDPSVIDEAISCWKDAPIAYGLDIGVTSDGRTLVVEVMMVMHWEIMDYLL